MTAGSNPARYFGAVEFLPRPLLFLHNYTCGYTCPASIHPEADAGGAYGLPGYLGAYSLYSIAGLD